MKTFKFACLALLTVLVPFSLAFSQNAETPLYLQPEVSVEERVEDLLSRMTLAEKVGQMTQLNNTMINVSGEQRDLNINLDKAREFVLTHHVGSFLNGEGESQEEWLDFLTQLQKIAVEESRLGIPIIYGIDHMHGASYLKNSTIFPHSINIAATFDATNAYNAGYVTAYESSHLGHRWNFAPVLDLGREPRWPRQYETFGESPYLASKLGVAYVEGLQGPNDWNDYQVAATAKHFLGYSEPKSGWDRSPVELSDQSLYEFHVPSFRAAIDAGIKTVMLNSGEINGVPVHASKPIVTTLLRDELGFEGVVVTDWDDIGKLFNFHYVAETYKEAVYQAVDAGIDMSMTPTHLDFNTDLISLVEEGRISEERIDESVRRILKLKFDIGLFEYPFPESGKESRLRTAENVEKAFKAAQQSMVLLENDGVLPLDADREGAILVTGPSAASKRNLGGGWTIAWQGGEEYRYPEDMKTLYDAMVDAFPNSEIYLVEDWTNTARIDSISEFVDLAVVAFGEEPYTEFVGNIRDLTLPAEQLHLVETLADHQLPVVGVYVGGRPRLVTDFTEYMSALLWAGLPGFEGAGAITSILTGEFNPSGRLPFSYPRFPSHFAPYNHKPSDVYFFNPEEANDIQQGEASIWQYPFGYGLSYTTFEYSDLSMESEFTVSADNDDPLVANVTIQNVGSRAGVETVLWYIQDVTGSVTRPVRELKGVEKVSLAPGESTTLKIQLDVLKDLTYPIAGNKYRLESGTFRLHVGNQTKEFSVEIENGVKALEFDY